ncbi:MAG: gamma-aminobutyraldehyde dehydrogenase [Candidatus Pacearchaeota archaeon]|nr:MAG: gamma-aminobutyraldehyde dehydrogenase [Candidatus Pacearchaeota archaeon]
MQIFKNYINGKYISFSTKTISVISPYTEKEIAKIVDSNEKDVNEAVKAAKNAFRNWKNTTPKERSELFFKLAELIENNKEELSRLESKNQGKPISLARLDFEFAIDNLKFFASAVRNFQVVMPGTYIDKHFRKKHKALGTSILVREPVGVVASIVPWNYPFMIACWKLAAVAAGNTIILKPSSLTPLTALKLAEFSEKAGFPSGVINIILGSGENVGRILASHPEINMISLTGNTETGKEIMRLASSNLKRVHLELGGKAPFIVFEDADLEKAAKYAVDSSIINSGQDCTAASRIYVQEKVYEKFISMVKSYAEKISIGDPSKDSTVLGPLISKNQTERVSWFLKNLEKDEKIVWQSKVPKKGYFFPITIIKNFSQKGNLCKLEVFGPIIAIAKFKTTEEAIEKANDVDYGLASSIWTKNIEKAFLVANSLRFGEVWINDHLPLVSEMPHGGIKQSGYGSDLSIYSLQDYTYLKHIYVGFN